MGSLAGYKIIKKIGVGGTCSVYLGEGNGGLKVAVKIMNKRLDKVTMTEIELMAKL